MSVRPRPMPIITPLNLEACPCAFRGSRKDVVHTWKIRDAAWVRGWLAAAGAAIKNKKRPSVRRPRGDLDVNRERPLRAWMRSGDEPNALGMDTVIGVQID